MVAARNERLNRSIMVWGVASLILVGFAGGCSSLKVDVAVYNGPMVDEPEARVAQGVALAKSIRDLADDLSRDESCKKYRSIVCKPEEHRDLIRGIVEFHDAHATRNGSELGVPELNWQWQAAAMELRQARGSHDVALAERKRRRKEAKRAADALTDARAAYATALKGETASAPNAPEITDAETRATKESGLADTAAKDLAKAIDPAKPDRQGTLEHLRKLSDAQAGRARAESDLTVAATKGLANAAASTPDASKPFLLQVAKEKLDRATERSDRAEKELAAAEEVERKASSALVLTEAAQSAARSALIGALISYGNHCQVIAERLAIPELTKGLRTEFWLGLTTIPLGFKHEEYLAALVAIDETGRILKGIGESVLAEDAAEGTKDVYLRRIQYVLASQKPGLLLSTMKNNPAIYACFVRDFMNKIYDQRYWSPTNIGEAETVGEGLTVLVKDKLGNWHLKAVTSDPTKIVEASSAVAKAMLSAYAQLSGGAVGAAAAAATPASPAAPTN